MTDKKLTSEQIKAITDLKNELLSKFGKHEHEIPDNEGLIPTCCDKCREKDLYKEERVR